MSTVGPPPSNFDPTRFSKPSTKPSSGSGADSTAGSVVAMNPSGMRAISFFGPAYFPGESILQCSQQFADTSNRDLQAFLLSDITNKIRHECWYRTPTEA